MMLFKSKKQDKNPITVGDVNKLYQRPQSISDWLPWTDYEEESQTFTLEDGH